MRKGLMALGGGAAAVMVLGMLRTSVVLHGLTSDAGALTETLARERTILAVLGAVGVVGVGIATALLLRRERAQQEAAQEAAEKRQVDVLSRMSAVLAHELRNPLASAKGHSQLLEEMVSADENNAAEARQVVQELMRLERLTDRLIAFARAGHIRRQPRDPAALARSAASQVTGSAPIHVVAERAPLEWALDGPAMEQVIINLLRNALQAQEGSREPVVLTVEEQADALHISVRDHGPGVPPGVELFTPFVTTKASGVGLGLALSRQIVRAHAGTITITTHAQGGAVVDIILPPTSQPQRRTDAFRVGSGETR